MGFCVFCALICVHSSFAIITMGKKELVVFLCLSSWCFVIVVWLFLVVPWVCLQFVIVVFPDHTYLLFFIGVLARSNQNAGIQATYSCQWFIIGEKM